MKLICAVAVRQKSDPLSVGRPNRLTVSPVAAGELAYPIAVYIDNPQITDAFILDFIDPRAGKDYLFAVWRYRRIGDALHIHKCLFVERSGRAFLGLGQGAERERE